MTGLRFLKEGDFEEVYKLTQELFDYSVYSKYSKLDKETCRLLYNKSLEDIRSSCAICIYNESEIIGIIIGSTFCPLHNRNLRTATELAFWIVPEQRNSSNLRLLIGAFKEWAKRVGCHNILLAKIKNRHEMETSKIWPLVQ